MLPVDLDGGGLVPVAARGRLAPRDVRPLVFTSSDRQQGLAARSGDGLLARVVEVEAAGQPLQGEGDGHGDLPGERRRERNAERGEEVDDVEPPGGLGRLRPDDHPVADPGLEDPAVVGHQHLRRDPVPVLHLLDDRDRHLHPRAAHPGPADVAAGHLLHPEVVGLQLGAAHRLARPGGEARRLRLLGGLARVRELGGATAVVGRDVGLAGGGAAGHAEAPVPAVALEGGLHREEPPAPARLVDPLLGHLPAHHPLPDPGLDEHLLARDPDALPVPRLERGRGLEPADLLATHVEPVPLGLGARGEVEQGGVRAAVAVRRRRLAGGGGSRHAGGRRAGERAGGEDSPGPSSHRERTISRNWQFPQRRALIQGR